MHWDPFSFGYPPYIWLDEGEGRERNGLADIGLQKNPTGGWRIIIKLFFSPTQHLHDACEESKTRMRIRRSRDAKRQDVMKVETSRHKTYRPLMKRTDVQTLIPVPYLPHSSALLTPPHVRLK
jgi:hypothetical protein